MEERRKFFRFPTNLKASYYLREEKENLEECNILNVSYTGMGVKFYALEKIETCSEIHLEIISKRQVTPISVTGTLSWIGGGGLMPFVGGLELTESLESLQLIKLF